MKNIIFSLSFLFSFLMNVNSQEIIFKSSGGRLQFDEIIFMENGKTTQTMNLHKENPYNSLINNFKDSTFIDAKTFKVSYGNAKKNISGLSSENQIKSLKLNDTTMLLLHTNIFVSWTPFQAIKSYRAAAISYSIFLSTMDYETTIASQSIVKAYNNQGEEIYSEVVDKYVTSVGITSGYELFSYSWDCDWSNCDLFEPGYKILDLKSGKVVLEAISKNGYPFTWQIENGIGWRDLYNGKELTFYLLTNGETVIIENNLIHGVIKIEKDWIVLIKNNGERYSMPRHHTGINVLNNKF
ncbi:MAG: hypothetical protein Q8K02_14335 [Flavobacterium sp.]|nr:hypothetical protein [Flavobacterium sp.]